MTLVKNITNWYLSLLKSEQMNNRISLLALLFLIGSQVSSQSPWINKKGSLYGQYSFTYLSYKSVINDEVNVIVPTDFRSTDITSNIYSEYSLNDNLAILVSVPYKSIQHKSKSLSGLGDPSVKLKYKIGKEIPLSGYLGYTAPLSKREDILRTGYKQHGIEAGLSVGKGMKKSFTYVGLGYRYRSNIPNQVLIEFEYGYRFLIAEKPFYTIFHIDGMLNTSSTTDLEAGQANFYHNDGEFISPALKFSYNVYDNFWLNAGLHSAFFVRYFGANSTLNIGIAYKIEK